MKIVINENERGFVFKYGKFQRMLDPGKHYIRRVFGESCFKATIDRAVTTVNNVDIKILMRDKGFSACVTEIDVPDIHYALHFEDGRVIDVLKPGTHYFWNVFHEHTFQLIDVSQPKVELKKELMASIPIML